MFNRNSIKKVDMKEGQCYNCQRLGHYARDCKFPKESRIKESEEFYFSHAGGIDYDDMFLMANT